METKVDLFFRSREEILQLEKVTEEHLFFQFSDVHFNTWDDASTDAEREQADRNERVWVSQKEDFARLDGDLLCEERQVASQEALKRIFAYVRQEKPEAVLFSGDLLDEMHPAGERLLRQMVQQCEVPVLIVPGNHETEACPELWEKGVRVYEGNGFRIVTADDRKRTVDEETLRVLRKLCREKIPMILLMHIPLMTEWNRETAERFDPYFFLRDETTDNNGRELLRLVCEEPAIRMILCGHVHEFFRSEFAPGKVQLCCAQSMTGSMVRFTVCGNQSNGVCLQI